MTPSRKVLVVSYSSFYWSRYSILISNVASRKKAQLPPMESKPSSEDILNAILPPREWVENGTIFSINTLGKHYIQYVSH